MSAPGSQPDGPSIVGFALLAVIATGMAIFAAMGAIFATAIGSRAPPAETMLLAFSPAILTVTVMGVAFWAWAKGNCGRGMALMGLAIAIVPVCFAIALVLFS